jgi:O-antigen ligase
LRNLDRLLPRNAFFYLCAIVVVAALVLGGGTRSGFVSDAILQLLAVPLLLASLWRFAALEPGKASRWALAFCAALVLVPLLQVIPLPPEIWTNLPNKKPEIEALRLAGQGLPWMPISVAPQSSLLGALSLIVPVSVFLGTSELGYKERRQLSLVLLGIGILSVFLGLSQVAQGPSSPLRFFDFKNTREAIGFFANRNHFAALLYSLTLFAAAWAIDAALAAGNSGPRRETSSTVALVTSYAALVALVAAQVMARSRAGLGLAIIALLGALALALADRRKATGVTPARVLGATVVLAIMFAAQFALYRVMERFSADPLQDARIPFALTTIEAARHFMPFGSGMGTFVPVYALFEKPQDVLANTFANRAHNDILEIWLETGAAGLALMAVFVAWFATRCVALWRRVPVGLRAIDGSLARAATLVVGLLIAHSCVDYPLRTSAMMTVFAFACALMIEPPGLVRRVEASKTESGWSQHRDTGAAQRPPAQPAFPMPSPHPAAQHAPSVDSRPGGAAPRPVRERWGKDIDWPEAWRSRPSRPRSDET